MNKQKTFTTAGHKYTGKQLSKLMQDAPMTNGGAYILDIHGVTYYAEYRQIQDGYFAPVCDKSEANVVTLAQEGPFQYRPQYWITL